MVVKIKGVIGVDITASMVDYQLNRENGDLVVELDSPGGLISDSISIFNSIAKYDKGKRLIRVTGEASSGASYIMFSGDSLEFAHNASVFIHPPQGGACGDYREMYSYASYLESLTKMFVLEYARYMNISEAEAREVVEAGTWFIGRERLQLLGDVYDSKEQQTFDENMIQQRAVESMTRMQNCITREMLTKDLSSCDQMFAGAQRLKSKPQMKAKIVTDKVIETEVIMDKTELKTKHPELYREVMQEGYDKGKAEEHSRVKAHMTMMAFAPEVAKQAIEDGGSFMSEELQARYMEARFKAQMIADKEADNPPPINSGEPVNTQSNGGQSEKTPEQQKQEAEMLERKNLRAALEGFGKKLPEMKSEGGAQ